jgi:uncharacterized membrane protein YqjE
MAKWSEEWIIVLIFYILTIIAFMWKLEDSRQKLLAKDKKIKEIESRVEELEKLVKTPE